MEPSSLFLPEIVLVASIMTIPGLYMLTGTKKSFALCSNLTLASILLFLIVSWFDPDTLSMESEVSIFLLYGHIQNNQNQKISFL